MKKKSIKKIAAIMAGTTLAFGISTATAVAISSSVAEVAEAAASGNIIDGTSKIEQLSLENFQSTCKSNDTVIIKGLTSCNMSTSSDNRPLVIETATTIQGQKVEGATYSEPSLSFGCGGIVLNADLTLKDLTISLGNQNCNAIIANGHTLTLENVKFNSGGQGINLFAGKWVSGTTYAGMPVLNTGNHGQIIITKGNPLGDNTAKANIYAGNYFDYNALYNQDDFNGKVTVTVESMNSTSDKLGAFYARSAQGRYYDLSLGAQKADTPIPLDNRGFVTGNVTLNLWDSSIQDVDAQINPNNFTFADVTYSSDSGYEKSVNLGTVNSFTVKSGMFGFKSDAVLSNITVNAGARLNFSDITNNDLQVGNFVSNGELVFNENQTLTVNDNLSGNSTVTIGSVGSYKPLENHNYIVYKGKNSITENMFTFSSLMGDNKLKFDSTNKTWNTNKEQSGIQKVDPKLLSITLNNGVTTYNTTVSDIGSGDASFKISCTQEQGEKYKDDVTIFDYPFQAEFTKPTWISGTLSNPQDNNPSSLFKDLNLEVFLDFDENWNPVISLGAIDPFKTVSLPAGTYTLFLNFTSTTAGTGNWVSKSITLNITDGSTPPPSTPTLQSISFSGAPKTDYNYGDKIDLASLAVTATMSDDSTQAVTTGVTYMINGNTIDANTTVTHEMAGNPIVASYNGKTVQTTALTVEKVLQNIEVAKNPNKLIYNYDEALDLTGLVVNAVYSDNSKTDVTSSASYKIGSTTVSNGTKLNHNLAQAITVSYQGKTATTNPLTVNKIATSIAINTQPKLSYTEDENLDLTSLKVKLNYSDNSFDTLNFDNSNLSYAIETAAISSGDKLTLAHNNKPITVKYGSFSATTSNLAIKAKPVTVTSIKFSSAPILNYNYNDTINLASFAVKATMSDGSQKDVSSDVTYKIDETTINASTKLSHEMANKSVKALYNGLEISSDPLTVNAIETGIEITKEPETIYVVDDNLDLSKLQVKVNKSDGTFDTLDFNNSNLSYSINGAPITNGTALTLAHNNQKITVKYKSFTANTYALTVTSAPIVTHTVTFDTDNKAVIPSIKIAENSKVTKPQDPTATGFMFKGWYKDNSFSTAFDFATETITADTTIFAKWEKIDIVDIEIEKVPKLTYNFGEKLDIASFKINALYNDGTKKDITKDAKFTINTTEITSATTLNHSMNSNAIIVSYGTFSKKTSALTIIAIEQSFSVNGVLKTDYTEGEKLDLSSISLTVSMSDGSTKNIAFNDKDIAFYAGSTKISHNQNIQYVLHNKEVSVSYKKLLPASLGTLNITKLPKSYTVTLNANKGTVENNQNSIIVQNTLPTPLPTATREGYRLVGWFYDRLLTKEAKPGDNLSSSVTLYAKWQTHHEHTLVKMQGLPNGVILMDENHKCNNCNHPPISEMLKNVEDRVYYMCQTKVNPCNLYFEDKDGNVPIGNSRDLIDYLTKVAYNKAFTLNSTSVLPPEISDDGPIIVDTNQDNNQNQGSNNDNDNENGSGNNNGNDSGNDNGNNGENDDRNDNQNQGHVNAPAAQAFSGVSTLYSNQDLIENIINKLNSSVGTHNVINQNIDIKTSFLAKLITQFYGINIT